MTFALDQIFQRLFVSIEGLPGRWAATKPSCELPMRVDVGAAKGPWISGPVTATYRDGRIVVFRSIGFFAIEHGLKSPPEKGLRAWVGKLARARLKRESKITKSAALQRRGCG